MADSLAYKSLKNKLMGALSQNNEDEEVSNCGEDMANYLSTCEPTITLD